MRQEADSGKTVVVVGLGNIGSQFVDHIGRMPGVSRVVLVDRDIYELKNLVSQNISRRDVGRSKARAQARRLRAINPSLEVVPIREDLTSVPVGLFRSDLIVAGLDSVEARIGLNEIAWRLGVPWIDGGVEPVQRLVRVTSFLPGETHPCFECALEDRDYSNLGTTHSCQTEAKGPAPTDGPASLGALTAALLAVECEEMLGPNASNSMYGRQVVFDPSNHRYFVSELCRNPKCRFDHEEWASLESLRIPRTGSLTDLLGALREPDRNGTSVSFDVANHPLVETLHCVRCGATVRRTHFLGRINLSCRSCQSRDLRATGFGLVGSIGASLQPKTMRRSLRSLGIKHNDVLLVHSRKRERHIVIECDHL